MVALRNLAMKKQQKKNQKKNSFWLYFIASPLIGIVLLFAWSVRLGVLATGQDAFWFTVLLLPTTVLVLFALGTLLSRQAVAVFRTKRVAVGLVMLSGILTVALSVLASQPLAQRACETCTGASFADAPLIFLLFFLPIMAGSLVIPLLHPKKNTL